MKLILEGNDFVYECENLIRIFYPGIDLTIDDGDFIVVSSDPNPRVFISVGGKELLKEAETEDKSEWAITGLLYDALCIFTGRQNIWGMLTGVRPVKLCIDMMKKGLSREEVLREFIEKFKVSPDKAVLTYECAETERPIIASSKENSVSVYVGIPFCPTRCKYCSFVCEGINSSKNLVSPYIDLLTKEIEFIGEKIKENGLEVASVYVGGGTPTSVSVEELYKYLSALNKSVNAKNTPEFTVEAGRPDTITREKLEILKEAGVHRISVNPQTLNDEVLREIGRDHTREDFLRGYALAKEMGAFMINVDLIAGLPKDTEQSFLNSVNSVLSLNPDNITLHTLTLKRSAELYTHKENYLRGEETAREVALAVDLIKGKGYNPYYMYRQKNTLGALENTGFSLGKTECLYNIYIMDETHSIVAAGAGASSKAVSGRNNIIRSFNYKFPREYISGFEEILKRKEKFFENIKNAGQI